ncbi:hypothetical protein GF312_02385 [Candidatus Poribacteria bacterium]|nr:hypothetical protein [Candidatus Poribacteria bacterium]
MEIPFWAKEQLRLRQTFNDWITKEIDKYQEQGFQKLFGSKGGHAMDEAGGYTRSFVGAYCLSGDERIPVFMKQFRDDWKTALDKSGHFYHGYDSNESGDYITHTAEAFSQFLLNVLYLDISDEKTIQMVDDGAEHLGNWCPDIQDWYDWDRHIFLSYFLGTKSPYHKPPYDFQTPRHFRVLQIALAAYEANGNERYMDLCKDYCDFWAKWILDAPSDEDTPTHFYMISKEQFKQFTQLEPYKDDWRFKNYYANYPDNHASGQDCVPSHKIKDLNPPYHVLNDVVMTWLEILKYAPQETYKEALRRLMSGWIKLGTDLPSQIAGFEPHCGVHLPKYRDFTGDTSLDREYLSQWSDGSASYLLTGNEDCLIGVASAADAILKQAIQRNVPDSKMGTDHACSHYSNAGTTSAYVAPALFMPVFGGLNVHYGRAPWVNVLYYTGGKIGLPEDMAVLYIPSVDGHSGVKFFNAGTKQSKINVQLINPAKGENLKLLQPPKPENLIDIVVEPGSLGQIIF